MDDTKKIRNLFGLQILTSPASKRFWMVTQLCLLTLSTYLAYIWIISIYLFFFVFHSDITRWYDDDDALSSASRSLSVNAPAIIYPR